jgi:uncharacterized protein
MLELRPICENCARPLPPESAEARICSFECTFCADCVDEVLSGVCPNCGGNFVPRPIRPATDRQGGNYLGAYPASTERLHRPVEAAAHARLVAEIAEIPPSKR